MAAIAVGESTSEQSSVKNHMLEAQSQSQVAASTRNDEVDLIARVLSAVSTHTNLNEALMSLYEPLDPVEARQQITLVLKRMRRLLPHDLPEDIAEACGYDRPWAEGSEENTRSVTRHDLLYRLAIPAVCLLGTIMLALSVVGAITTIHYMVSMVSR